MDASTLSKVDIETLYSLLHHQPAPSQEKSWWVIANEIMEQMRLHAIAPERYGKELLGIMRDPAAPEVLRDYAVQHLGQWVSPRGAALGLPHEQDPAIIRETAETLAQLIIDPATSHSSIPGTSLMLLIDMQGGGVSEEIIAPVLASLTPWFSATVAENSNSSKITRISAINAIGMLHLASFRPDIRALATSATAEPSLRLNSIATLGQIGEERDLATLASIAQSDTRLRYAAQSALKHLTDSLQ